VKLDLRFLGRDEYASYLNNASAVACLPYDEDSLSYVAMEAANAGKPLISTTDSGGVLSLARNGETGWVVEPSDQVLAEAMGAALADEARSRRLGSGAKDLWQSLDVTWPKTVEALLS
jgi:glycosyltransferase involved in cell wall biosynthesis